MTAPTREILRAKLCTATDNRARVERQRPTAATASKIFFLSEDTKLLSLTNRALMADLNNVEVALVMERWLKLKGLAR